MFRKTVSAAVAGAMLLPALPLAAQDASSSSSAASVSSSSASSVPTSSASSSSSSSSVDKERGVSDEVRRRNEACKSETGWNKSKCLREMMQLIQFQWKTRERGVFNQNADADATGVPGINMKRKALRNAMKANRRSVRQDVRDTHRRSMQFWKLKKHTEKRDMEENDE